jgi:hypothetical protein
MPDGGVLIIETRNVDLDAGRLANGETGSGRYVAISVRDTGCGMTSDVRERAFEPFYTTKEVGTGSGLGLSQVYGFVKQSGGQVEISSEFGAGTTVSLYLPRIGDAAATTAVAPNGRTRAGVGATERKPSSSSRMMRTFAASSPTSFARWATASSLRQMDRRH